MNTDIHPGSGDFKVRQVYEQVADTIKVGILNGTYREGARLPSERELASRLKVSRPAVREAIGALQNEGHVITRRGSGTYVTAPLTQVATTQLMQATSRDADISPISILEVRMIIEPAIARMAARHKMRDEMAEHYLNVMDSMSNVTKPEDQFVWGEADGKFHHQLAVMTKDALMLKIADEIAKSVEQPLWNRLRDDGIYDPMRMRLYVAEHRLIYEAIVTGDGDAAAFYVEGHLKRVYRDFVAQEE